MPTAAKLAAAILFGALAWVVSRMVIPLFPEGTNARWFAEANAVVGVVIGWRVAGPRARTTLRGALGYGLTAAIATLLAALLLHAFLRMLRDSMRKLYDGPMDAVVGVVELMVAGLQLIAVPQVIGAILIGGLVAGLVTEWVGRNFR